MQPLFTNNVDLSKPIKLTPSQGGSENYKVGDIYFDGIVWKRVAATVGGTFAVQDCTKAVRAIGMIYAPDGVAWSVAAWEQIHAIKAEDFKGFLF